MDTLKIQWKDQWVLLILIMFTKNIMINVHYAPIKYKNNVQMMSINLWLMLLMIQII